MVEGGCFEDKREFSDYWLQDNRMTIHEVQLIPSKIQSAVKIQSQVKVLQNFCVVKRDLGATWVD